MSTQEIEDIIKDLIVEIKKIVKGDVSILSGNVVLLVTKVIELVEKIKKKLTSEDKYQIAYEVSCHALKYIPRNKLSKEDREDIKLMIPNTIETIIKASKGDLGFGKNKPKPINKVKLDSVVIVDRLYQRLKKFIIAQHFAAENIATNVTLIISKLMSFVEEYPYLTGTEKKDIVLKTLDNFQEDLELLFPKASDETIGKLRTGLKMAPKAIDTLIMISKNLFFINLRKKIKKLFRCQCCKK